MNKTLKEIAYSILESIYDHKISDDHNISIDFVIAKINDVNARLIEEMAAQGKSLESFYQKQCCIEVKCDKPTCIINGKAVPSGDVVWYSEIPSLNVKIGWKNIIYLGAPDMIKGFKRVSFPGYSANAKLDWTKSTIFSVVGNKIFYRDLPTSGIQNVCLIGILANPVDACNYNDANMYPTPDAYKLELLVKQDILSTYPSMPKDESQDSRDGANPQVKQQSNE